ncbi:Sensor protein QseC [Achromobacter mucicolens]|uniref:ATP-binding protein n=1 Tax=Achromobacter mucicolens TaxID=1389922 RepID=UPI001466E4DE|nr:ATP-binding protein [Achromobacter mucicolens]CAB3832017.1 Sensor protein QseC [Achromobacter mucicolens]
MSLRLRAVLIAGISLAVLWAAAAAWMMQGVRTDLDRTLDGRLAMSARMVAGLLERGALELAKPDGDLAGAVRVDGGEGISCLIRGLHGEVLARTNDSPAGIDHVATGYSVHEEGGRQWRVYVHSANGYQITTADRIDQRNLLIEDLLRAAGVPFLIAVLGGLGALWIGIGRGLAPLENLRNQLRARQTEDTSLIAVNRSPAELRPVLDAMNGLLGRLAAALSSQRAFTDAAAHELRTPLTVIDTHLQVIRLTDREEAEFSLRSAEEGVRRLRRTLDQMMTLARTEADVTQQEGNCASIVAAVQTALGRLGDDERDRVDVIIDGEDQPAAMPKSMLETAVRNLTENAVLYSPKAQRVDVAVVFDRAAACCRITVADRGPGLGQEQIAQIGRRFWRGDQGRKQGDGSGLGISIVRAISDRFGAQMRLGPRPDGGLVAEISVPLCVSESRERQH